MPKYFFWDKYEMSQPLICQFCRESQTIKSSLKCSKRIILFLESRMYENDDGTSRSKIVEETQGNSEHNGKVHCKKLLLDIIACFVFFFKIHYKFTYEWQGK